MRLGEGRSDSNTRALLSYSHFLSNAVLVMSGPGLFELCYYGNQRLLEGWIQVESFSHLELVGVVEVGVEAVRM